MYFTTLPTSMVHIISCINADMSVGGMYGDYIRKRTLVGIASERHKEWEMRKGDMKRTAVCEMGEKRREILREKDGQMDRKWGGKGWERHSGEKEHWCPTLGETNGSSSVSSVAYVWCVSLSICACHAPPLPMHDNYPAPECVRWHPASVAAQNFRRQQRLCAGDATHMGENYILWMQFGQVLNKKTARLGLRH